jgi:glycerol-3-phosphate dehydrogenase (NAD(P)+)
VKLAILGAGAWGSALAVALATRHAVSLWARDAALLDAIRSARCNARYLPGIAFPGDVMLVPALPDALGGASLVIVATPVAGLREMLQRVAAVTASPLAPVVWVCKGFETGTRLLPHEVSRAVLGDDAVTGVLSGPSFAQEVAAGLPVALTLASRSPGFAARGAALVHGGRIRVYSSADVVGVEVAGAVKNVMAIAAGICDGLGLGHNARAALVTRGLAEVTRLGMRLGGRAETFMGLAGIGDLILTCTGDLSRNRRIGLDIGRGGTLAASLDALGHVAEGARTAPEVLALADRLGVAMPITEAVCAVLFDGLPPARAVERLLSRDAREEHPPGE